MWTEDEAGPDQTLPSPGTQWQPLGLLVWYPHDYVRRGTAKHLRLFHPASGVVRVKGVRRCTNAVLHPWLEAELARILAALPEPTERLSAEENRRRWERWQEGLTVRITLPDALPPLRMLLVLDTRTGHLTASFVRWLFAHGIMPLYTPLRGSWLNMAESIQRILTRRALVGHHPQTPEAIITGLEATAAGWNRAPTPFVWVGSGRRDGSGHGSVAMRSGDQGHAPHGRSPGVAPHEDMAMTTPTDPLVHHEVRPHRPPLPRRPHQSRQAHRHRRRPTTRRPPRWAGRSSYAPRLPQWQWCPVWAVPAVPRSSERPAAIRDHCEMGRPS